MGVMSCARRGCENIMCDRYSSEHGYICNECFKELVSRGVDQSITEFMDEHKNEESRVIFAYDYFDSKFPLQD